MTPSPTVSAIALSPSLKCHFGVEGVADAGSNPYTSGPLAAYTQPFAPMTGDGVSAKLACWLPAPVRPHSAEWLAMSIAVSVRFPPWYELVKSLPLLSAGVVSTSPVIDTGQPERICPDVPLSFT